MTLLTLMEDLTLSYFNSIFAFFQIMASEVLFFFRHDDFDEGKPGNFLRHSRPVEGVMQRKRSHRRRRRSIASLSHRPISVLRVPR